QIISPGVTWISGFDATSTGSAFLDEDVREDRPEQAVEHDRLRQGEAEPLDALELAPELRLPGDRLDHRAEDVAAAYAGAQRAEAEAEREPDGLPCLRDVPARGGEDRGEHLRPLLSAPARSPSRCRWRTVQRR